MKNVKKEEKLNWQNKVIYWNIIKKYYRKSNIILSKSNKIVCYNFFIIFQYTILFYFVIFYTLFHFFYIIHLNLFTLIKVYWYKIWNEIRRNNI